MVNKIIDCFTFYNELKILKFRLEYLYDYVDYFVLVEATLTHSGNPKELYYENNKHLFEKYKDKIIHVIAKDLSPLEKTNDSWVRENEQRNAIDKGIQIIENRYGLNDNDIILVSDADEITDRKIIEFYKNFENKTNDKLIYILAHDHYWYNLTCYFNKTKFEAAALFDMNTYKKLFNRKANDTRGTKLAIKIIEKAGWHFSYFGDSDFIINKVKSYAHQEYNNDFFTNPDLINHCIKNNITFIRPNNTLHGGTIYLPIEENKYLPDKYELLL